MSGLISLPMYGLTPADVEPFWQSLAQHLRQAGLAVPASLQWPADLEQHWREPALLLSQTCGYPLVEELRNSVQLVGTFSYAAPGCNGSDYRSLLLARADDARTQLAEFRGATLVFNARNSHSGYNALRALVAPLAGGQRFFGAAHASGGHYASLAWLTQGRADLSAIDCVSLALLERAQPEALAGFKCIGQTGSAPGLPLITGRQTTPTQLAQLRTALQAVCADPGAAQARARLLLNGFHVLPLSAYAVCRRMRADAAALGCEVL